MPTAATTSELYSDPTNSGTTLGAPPSSPAPVPPADNPTVIKETTRTEVVNQPIATKERRMADEGPDGRVKDTSGDAMRAGNDLNYRNITAEDDAARVAELKKENEPKPQEAAPVEKPKEAPKVETTAQEKVYAGKFKSVEELEKGYLEAQKAFHQKATELATKEQAKPAVEVPKTPAQIAAEEAEKAQFLEKFVANPKQVIEEYQQKAIQTTQVALAAQQVAADWRKANPDLVDHEVRVAFEANLIAQSDPELAQDYASLINKATEQFRQFTGKLRSEGAKEALTQQTRVIPLLSPTTTASTEQPSQTKAPLTSDDAYSLHLKMLKNEEQKSRRGLRR